MKSLNAILLIVGTSVGAGMLGLPVETAQAGFVPAAFLFFLSWAVMIVSGFLFAEVLGRYPVGANFTTLSHDLLGKKAMYITLFFYLVLFFSLLVAYTKGIGLLLEENFLWVGKKGPLLFIIFMIPLLYLGTNVLGRINGLLTIFLFFCYGMLISIGIKHIHIGYLQHASWGKSFSALPLIVTSFGFHGTLPSLVSYLDRDLYKIRKAIVIGSTITLSVYLLWQALVLGSVPLFGEVSLAQASLLDQTAITPMSQLFKHSALGVFALLFSFTAVTTSFLGVSVGFVDFLTDALQLKRTKSHKMALLILIYVPALLFSYKSFRIFYLSLKYGASPACIFLLIFLPALMHRVIVSRTTGEEIALVSQRYQFMWGATGLFSIFSLASCFI